MEMEENPQAEEERTAKMVMMMATGSADQEYQEPMEKEKPSEVGEELPCRLHTSPSPRD